MLFQLFESVLFSSHVYGSFAAADARLAEYKYEFYLKIFLPHCVAVSFAATTCSLMHFLISRTMIELLCCHYYYYFACLPSARANYFYELVQLFLSSSAFGVFRDHSLANLSQGTSFVLILIYIWWVWSFGNIDKINNLARYNLIDSKYRQMTFGLAR